MTTPTKSARRTTGRPPLKEAPKHKFITIQLFETQIDQLRNHALEDGGAPQVKQVRKGLSDLGDLFYSKDANDREAAMELLKEVGALSIAERGTIPLKKTSFSFSPAGFTLLSRLKKDTGRSLTVIIRAAAQLAVTSGTAAHV